MARPSPTTLTKRAERAYVLRVLYNGQPKNIPGVPSMQSGEWVLPVAPAAVQYRANARTSLYAVKGNLRGVDEQGVDPPIITISGSFGEAGAYLRTVGGLDGRTAQRHLEWLIRGYLKLAHDEGMGRLPLHVLEWHDLYRDESWIVTPALVPYGAEDASRPLLENYQLQLTALAPVAEPVESPPPLESALAQPHPACPLNPRCRFGGPSVPGCPWRRK